MSAKEIQKESSDVNIEEVKSPFGRLPLVERIARAQARTQWEYETRLYDALDNRNAESAKYWWKLLTNKYKLRGNKIVLLRDVDDEQFGYFVDHETQLPSALKTAAHEECFEKHKNHERPYFEGDVGILAIYAETAKLECAICGNRLYRPEITSL